MDLSSLTPIRKLDIGLLRQTLNTDNISSDENKVQSKETQLLPEIFRLLASLEDDSQKMLLDSWAKLEMPLNKNTVSTLLNYLEKNPASNSEDKMAVIKAFAFLESNGLPFSDKLIDALRSVFNNKLNIKLQNFLAANKSMSKEQLNMLLSKLDLNEFKEQILKINYLNFNAEISSNNSKNNSNSFLSSELLNSLNSIDQESRNLILNNPELLSKNFSDKTLKVINQYLANNNPKNNAEKTALLKSFSFLRSQKLPLTENLINALKEKFMDNNLEKSVENWTNKDNLSADFNLENKSLISKNEAAVNLNLPPEKLAESLAEYNKLSDQILSLFNKIGGQDEEKIADNLLGQKLINLQQLEENSSLMLALEIPVQLNKDKLSSLLLKIERDNQSEQKNEIKGYKITFIMEFENIGAVQSNINIKNKEINSTFFSNSAATAKLIERHFNDLRSSLNNLGYKINSLRIKKFTDFAEKKEGFFNDLILAELNNSGEGKYTHVDIKI